MVCAVSPVVESLVGRYEAIGPHLSEGQRRLWLGVEARELGRGGVRVVADAVGVCADTVRRGREWSVPVFVDTGLCRNLVDVPIA